MRTAIPIASSRPNIVFSEHFRKIRSGPRPCPDAERPAGHFLPDGEELMAIMRTVEEYVRRKFPNWDIAASAARSAVVTYLGHAAEGEYHDLDRPEKLIALLTKIAIGKAKLKMGRKCRPLPPDHPAPDGDEADGEDTMTPEMIGEIVELYRLALRDDLLERAVVWLDPGNEPDVTQMYRDIVKALIERRCLGKPSIEEIVARHDITTSTLFRHRKKLKPWLDKELPLLHEKARAFERMLRD
jgi:hypothetical protein